MNLLVKDILLTFLLPLAAGYAVLVTMRERQRRAEIDEAELKKDVKQFMGEFKQYLNDLNTALREHAIVQKVTTDTLSGLVVKLEKLEQRVNTHDTQFAILKIES